MVNPSASGGLRPPGSLPGLRPGPRWGTPSNLLHPGQIPSYATDDSSTCAAVVVGGGQRFEGESKAHTLKQNHLQRTWSHGRGRR